MGNIGNQGHIYFLMVDGSEEDWYWHSLEQRNWYWDNVLSFSKTKIILAPNI